IRTTQKTQVDSLGLMLVLKNALATDPKDKVIGAQAILQRIGLDLSGTSYSMGTEKLYVYLTVSWLSRWRNLTILAMASSTGLADDHVSKNLPSWAIDWNDSERKDDGVILDDYSRLVYLQCADSVATKHISATCSSVLPTDALLQARNTGQILLDGYVLTTIRSVIGPSNEKHRYLKPEETDKDRGRLRLAAWVHSARTVIRWALFISACSENTPIGAVLRSTAAMLNVGPKVLIDLRYGQATKGLESELQAIVDLATCLRETDESLAAALKTHAATRTRLWRALTLRVVRESLVLTRDGRMGITSSGNAQINDVIVLAVGSDFPLLLQQGLQDDHFTFEGVGCVSDLPTDAAAAEKPVGIRELMSPSGRFLALRNDAHHTVRGLKERGLSEQMHAESESRAALVSSLMRGWKRAEVCSQDRFTKLVLI
ncbi:hypothetical protein LTR95_015875, partial [Oleoguttula sp. CCFEE 5521]